MQTKRNVYINILKITLLLTYFCMLTQVLAMNPLNKPFSPDLTEQESIEKEASALILKSQRKKQCYYLLMLLDPNWEKKDPMGIAFGGLNLNAAFSEKSFPIIVSSNLIENYCSWKKGLGKSPFPAEVMYRFYPIDKDWLCYSHKKAPIVLFVPKNYIAHFSPSSENISITEQMHTCGFDVANLHTFENILPDTLLKYIENQGLTTIDDYDIQASDIESLFVKPTIPNSPLWNIYLMGHGTVLDEKGKAAIAGLEENEFFKLIKVFEKIGTSFLFYSTCYSGGQNLIKVQKELAKLTVNFMVGTQGINEQPILSFIELHGFFRSTKFTQLFNKLETFFANPKNFVAQMKNVSWTKDPIAFLMSYAIDKNALDYCQPWVYTPAAGVFNAFSIDKSIRIITNSLARIYEFEGKTLDFTDSNIRTIIVCPHYIGIPLKIKSHVAIVSPTGLMIENEPIAFEEKKKVKEDDEKEWITKESTSKIIHVFEKITYEDKLSSIIPNFMSFHYSFFPITFTIKDLNCFDYNNSKLSGNNKDLIAIKNMIISKYPLRPGVSMIIVLFNYDNSIYSFSREIEDLYGTGKKLFDQFNNLPARELKPDDLNHLLKESNLFKHCGLDNVNSDYVSLEKIVELIESRINKDFTVQEPGALKKSLLFKQKNILEKSIHPFATPSNRTDIDYQKKRIAYAKMLPKRIEQAKELEENIKQLPEEELMIKTDNSIKPISAQQIYLKDIAEIQQELAHQYDTMTQEGYIEKPSLMRYVINSFSTFFNKLWEAAGSVQRYFTGISLRNNPYLKKR